MPLLSPASTNSTFMSSVTPLFFPVKTDNIYILFCNYHGIFCFCPPGSSTEETHHRSIFLLHEPDYTWGGQAPLHPPQPPSPSSTLWSWPKPSLDRLPSTACEKRSYSRNGGHPSCLCMSPSLQAPLHCTPLVCLFLPWNCEFPEGRA